MASANNNLIEYAGVFVNLIDNNQIIKLYDTPPFIKPKGVQVQESALR